MGERLIVIGGTAAGLSAASKAKRLDPSMEITVFERSGYISYGACGLPYYIGGLISDPEDLVSLSVEQVTNERHIPTFIHHEVVEVNRENKQVKVRNLDNGNLDTYPYDKLVIATGAVPVRSKIKGGDAKGVYYLRTVEDGIQIKRAALHADTTVVSIIGGGFIGLELAEELSNAGLSVHLFEMQSRLLSFLSESISQKVEAELQQHKIHVHLSTQVQEIISTNGKVCGILDSENYHVQTDIVIVCTGVRPSTELAIQAGLKLGAKGAIAVNEEMQTSDPSIWAAGDCVEVLNRITGKMAYIPFGATANKQGRIAGSNIAGQHKTFPGVVGSMITKTFDLYIAATGLTEEQAVAEGYDIGTTIITKRDRASYYPGGAENHICFIFEKGIGRLLGAQAAGSETVSGRINVLATAITCKMTVEQISQLDLVYAPPVAPVYDPIIVAAEQALKKVRV